MPPYKTYEGRPIRTHTIPYKTELYLSVTQSYCRHKVASLSVGRVTQSRDWRLLIAQVQREARELPVRTSIDSLAKVIGERET